MRPTGPDEHDILVGGRTVKSGLTEQQARKFLREHASSGDRTLFEEEDGYRRRF